MKYRKFNKYEKREVRSQMLEDAQKGEGLYLYRNSTNADLTLPRPTKSGIRAVGPLQEFQGDNYYMQLVKTGFLRLVKELQSPAQERALNEAALMQDRLILDQPDTVTSAGKVEHVVNKPDVPVQKLNENGKAKLKQQPEVLINESPVDSFVIVGD